MRAMRANSGDAYDDTSRSSLTKPSLSQRRRVRMIQVNLMSSELNRESLAFLATLANGRENSLVSFVVTGLLPTQNGKEPFDG